MKVINYPHKKNPCTCYRETDFNSDYRTYMGIKVTCDYHLDKSIIAMPPCRVLKRRGELLMTAPSFWKSGLYKFITASISSLDVDLAILDNLNGCFFDWTYVKGYPFHNPMIVGIREYKLTMKHTKDIPLHKLNIILASGI